MVQLRSRKVVGDDAAGETGAQAVPVCMPSAEASGVGTGDGDGDMYSTGSIVSATLLAIGKALASTIFSTNASFSLQRSAIFLMFFLFVHMLGNLLIFVGPEVFNTYGYFLHINPLLKFIEASDFNAVAINDEHWLPLMTSTALCGGSSSSTTDSRGAYVRMCLCVCVRVCACTRQRAYVVAA